MILRIAFLLLVSGSAYAQTQFQYNILIDEEEVVYQINEMDEKFRVVSDMSYSELDSFVHYLSEDLATRSNGKQELLFYVHGMWGNHGIPFSRSYQNMYKHFISENESDIACIVSLKWPSNDFEYKKNKELVHRLSPKVSAVMEDFFVQLDEINSDNEVKGSGVDMIAHSMGNEMIKEVLKYFDLEEIKVPVKQMIWAAPDLDGDIFDSDSTMLTIGRFAQRSHIYFSSRDLTLEISKQLNKKRSIGLGWKAGYASNSR